MALWLNLRDVPAEKLHTFREVRLILGDQLNAKHSWFNRNDNVLYVMFEMQQETNYVRHHKQKVLAFFAAMRAFSKALATRADVLYFQLDGAENLQSLTENLNVIFEHCKPKKFSYQEPDEYRLMQQLETLTLPDTLAIECCSTEHFLISRQAVDDYLPANKAPLMETFYRRVRKETGYLMAGDKPTGGKWNYDHDNRNKLPDKVSVPKPLHFANDATDIATMLDAAKIKTMGSATPKQLDWPISRQQSLQLLEAFMLERLPYFGQYQDAMSRRCYLLFHSRLSFSLNTKMISPKEVVEAALSAYEKNPTLISLAQVEGFIRQIIGWREFVRLIYWREMPSYKTLNHFEHDNPLPEFYWNADTKMNCVQHAVSQSLETAYAHHIQRLMITGNFGLLAGVHPDAMDEWYLGIYIDAIEWVELPNTRGMSQFADGGLLATKPYISSGNYINKMSSYCKDCYYKVSAKTGPRSCPFNSLYWHFLDKHNGKLANNPRMGMMYRQWEKQDTAAQEAILAQAKYYLANVDSL